MSKKSRGGTIPSMMWETYRAMSVDVGRLVPFFAETACMRGEERRIIAFIDGFAEMFAENKELAPFIEFLKKKVRPFYIRLGQSNWGRDVVTDLGFAKSKQKSRREKITKIFDFDPSTIKEE